MTHQTQKSAVFGATGPEPEPQILSTGPLHCLVAEGALRNICWQGVEIVRALDCPIRDVNWGTFAQTDIQEDLDISGEMISFRRTFKIDDGKVSGVLAIKLDSSGLVEARLDLTAHQTFATNRAGFSLLHPLAGVSGAPLQVAHPDGKLDETVFPQSIMPGQPVFDIAGLAHQVNGVNVDITFGGEVFEMEDQRNWSDASYKTYCRPLGLPLPYDIKPGETVSQTIRIKASGDPQPRSSSSEALSALQFDASPSSKRGPDILLAAQRDWATGETVQPGEGCNPASVQGYLARLDADENGAEDWIGKLAQQSFGHAAYLDLEIVVPDDADPAEHLSLISANIAAHGLSPRRILALPAAYLQSYQPNGDWPQGTTPELCAELAKATFPDAAIGVGMLSNFTEVNRCPPKGQIGDYLSHSTTAIVHAADDRSVLETLETLPFIFETGAKIRGARSRQMTSRLGLTSIGMRTNPYGADVAANPDRERVPMARDDPRQQGLFASSFAIAIAALAADAGIDALALAGDAGPFGMFNDDGCARPIFHAVRGLAQIAGLPLVASGKSTAGLFVIAAKADEGLTGLVSNCALTPAKLHFEHLADIRILDETSAGDAISANWLDTSPVQSMQDLELPRFATAFFTQAQSK